MRLVRCVPCLAFLAALVLASFAVHAQAQEGPLSSVSSDAILSLVGALLLALLAGYASGIDRRITREVAAVHQRLKVVEYDYRQVKTEMGLFRETVLERHPTRGDFTQLREDIGDRFDEIKALIRGRP